MKALLLLLALAMAAYAKDPLPVDYIPEIAKARKQSPTEAIILKGNERITTPVKFSPPVEIEIVAKTDSTNLRMSYAADEVIFNWEVDGNQFRIMGGPASGQHRLAKGAIPPKKFVTIRWVVEKGGQQIFVDGESRFQHTGDYSAISEPVTVFTANSRVTVKSLKVRQLPPK